MTITHKLLLFFSDQAVKTGIIYFELFNYLNQHKLQTIFF